jgi:transcriptional regulator with XRE-family HTH domain
MAKSSIMKTFGTNISILLDARGWTKSDLATEVGMDRSGLSKLIRGIHSPTLIMVEKIAAALDVEPFELLQPRELVGEK